jgi:hypothetical protein
MKRMTDEMRGILTRLDVDAALKHSDVLGFTPDTEEIAIAGMHKARLLAGRAFTKAQRMESRAWLRARGFKIPGQPR